MTLDGGVFEITHRMFGVLLAIASVLILLIGFWKPWLLLSRAEKRPTAHFRRSLAIAAWSTLVGIAASIWFWTVWKTVPSLSYRLIIYVTAVGVLALTFFLEGLETAVTDLSDKDEQQLEGQAADIFTAISKMGEDFFEAREWAVIALLVTATLMIDREAYIVPFLGTIDASSKWQSLFRVCITAVLTTCPFVWLAQSPGKHVARHNSAEFLRYLRTGIVFRALRGFWSVISLVGLKYPSEVSDRLALDWMDNCKKTRDLLPSEFSYFADSLKSYGFGILWASDTVHVDDEGACDIVLKSLAYVGLPREEIKRKMYFKQGFNRAEMEDQDKRFWAFKTPRIGERVTPELLKLWKTLFDCSDPSRWNVAGYTPIDTHLWRIRYGDLKPIGSIDLSSTDVDGQERDLQQMNVALDFREGTPSHGNAMLVLWEITFKTNKGSFRVPTRDDRAEAEDYFKVYNYPSLRSTVTINLPEHCIFARSKEYTVSYDNIFHDRETRRFRDQQLMRTQNVSGTELTLRVDSPLPASKYKVSFFVERTINKRQQIDVAEVSHAHGLRLVANEDNATHADEANPNSFQTDGAHNPLAKTEPATTETEPATTETEPATTETEPATTETEPATTETEPATTETKLTTSMNETSHENSSNTDRV